MTRTSDWLRVPLHREPQGRTRVQAVAFKERLLSEVMLRTPAFLLRRERKRIRGQISSSLIPFSFFLYFSRPRAQAVALQRQPPRARLRTVRRDRGRPSVKEQEECRNSSLCSGQEKEVRRRRWERRMYTCGEPGASFRPSALSHNHQNTALVPRVAGLFICSLASHGGPHPPIICCRFMSGVL